METSENFPQATAEEESAAEYMSYRVAFVINAGLKMGLGKVSAQVAHATVGLHESLEVIPCLRDMSEKWNASKVSRTFFRGTDTDQLLLLEEIAAVEGLQTFCVQDAGRTQVAPGSLTVLSIFGPDEAVSRVTGNLPPYVWKD